MVNASNSGENYLQRYVTTAAFHSEWVKKGMNGEKKPQVEGNKGWTLIFLSYF